MTVTEATTRAQDALGAELTYDVRSAGAESEGEIACCERTPGTRTPSP
jgi:hypothetical protein